MSCFMTSIYLELRPNLAAPPFQGFLQSGLEPTACALGCPAGPLRVPLSLLSLKEPPNRLAGFRVVLAVVQTEETAQCGGRLVLVDGLGTGPFPPELALGTYEGHPDVTRLRYLLSMILPVRVPSSMIHSDEDRCLPAVAPLRLQQ